MSESANQAKTTTNVAPAADGKLEEWVAVLGTLDRDISDGARIDRIRALEEIKAAACAAQAWATADLDASVRSHHRELRVRSANQGKGVASQIGLARRESPNRGAQHLGLAKVLVHEMPHTLAALTTGRLSEWRATLLVRETACLSLEHRQTVDRVLVSDPGCLDGKGDRALIAEAKKLAYRLDPQAVVRRARKAEAERRVSMRPAPDTMAYLTALLPVKQAVAAYAALSRDADTVRVGGDVRGRGQVMADTLVERITGQSEADVVPVDVQLVMTDRALFNQRAGNDAATGGEEPAYVPGYGPIPAETARDWILNPAVHAWLRRLYADPATGELVAMDSTHRLFPAGLRRFLIIRDQTCRTPWCDAPIRHTDHSVAASAGGQTSAFNGQGLCEACNYAKQAPGWRSKPRPGPRHTVDITTPTGHSYLSTAPPLIAPRGREPVTPDRARPSAMEQRFRDYILAG